MHHYPIEMWHSKDLKMSSKKILGCTAHSIPCIHVANLCDFPCEDFKTHQTNSNCLHVIRTRCINVRGIFDRVAWIHRVARHCNGFHRDRRGQWVMNTCDYVECCLIFSMVIWWPGAKVETTNFGVWFQLKQKGARTHTHMHTFSCGCSVVMRTFEQLPRITYLSTFLCISLFC